MYDKFAPILKEIVDFIKAFTKGLKLFINGFKTGYETDEPTTAAEEG